MLMITFSSSNSNSLAERLERLQTVSLVFLSFVIFFFFFPFLCHAPLSSPLPGLEFPWGPKPFAEVVAGPLLRNNRQTTDSSSLEGHYVGVYFSAHWVSREKTEEGQRCFTLVCFPNSVSRWEERASAAERSAAGSDGAVSGDR